MIRILQYLYRVPLPRTVDTVPYMVHTHPSISSTPPASNPPLRLDSDNRPQSPEDTVDTGSLNIGPSILPRLLIDMFMSSQEEFTMGIAREKSISFRDDFHLPDSDGTTDTKED